MAIPNPRQLPDTIALVDPETGKATPFFLRYFNDAVIATIQALAGTVNAQAAADAAAAGAAAADAAAVAASAAAAAADAAALGAQGAAVQVAADSALANSYVTGLTLTATDAGADATITISGHTRVYGDGTSVAVTGGALTALAYSTAYWITYLDPTRAGGAVTYSASTSAQGNGTPSGQHVVGAVTTPAALAAPVPGNPARPPGYPEP